MSYKKQKGARQIIWSKAETLRRGEKGDIGCNSKEQEEKKEGEEVYRRKKEKKRRGSLEDRQSLDKA